MLWAGAVSVRQCLVLVLAAVRSLWGYGMSDSVNQTQAGAQGMDVAADAAAAIAGASSSRRQMLRLGLVAGGVALTIKPGIAQAATSVISCNVDINTGGQMIAPDGSLVPAGTAGAFPGSGHFSGQSVYNALRGGTLPGTSGAQSQAYLNYMRQLRNGQPGYTCFASLQMPR